ncbi:hypothetical protein M9458_018430, partial [Cirrhinus mrigala]
AKAIWNANNPIIHSYEQFTNHFSEVFSTTTGHLSTTDQLFRLQQGRTSVTEYTLHFRTLVVASGWNEKALLGAYRQGLNPDIRAAMALYDDSIGLEAFLQRTTHVAQNLAACQPSMTAPQPASVVACSPVPEPMQIDSTRLSREERNRRLLNGLCLYCGEPGHRIRQCPVRPPRPMVSTLSTEVEISSLTMLPVTLHTSNSSLCVSALVDFESSGNFISQECLNQLQLTRRPHIHLLVVKTIQGKPLGCRKIRFSSPFITLQVGLFHYEEMRFLVLEDSTTSIILGQPGSENIIPNSAGAHVTSSAGVNTSSVAPVILPDQASVPEVPAEYMAFQDVFSKQAATRLPPHRPWDCAIDLLGEYILCPSRSAKAMEEDSFKHRRRRPLPASSWARRMGGYGHASKLDLRSAYNLVRIRAGDEWKTAFVTPSGHYEYRVMPYGLSISPSIFQTFMNEVFREFLHRFVIVYIDDNLIYSQNLAEHRQHVQQVLHKLHDHSLYFKLEKCEFHRPSVQFLGYIITAEGVQMGQGKVSAILEWPQQLTVKELQRFLGFANFYRRFIKDYSSITAPLTSLLRGKPNTLSWNPSAHEAFLHLKKIFSTAPLLHHPDPELPFTVEVDASTTGVGAVLSQAVGDPPFFHPCAYYSRKLSPAEQNYDAGNGELLAIKLALEEWRHWLEGSKHPFTIITDHKNLQYIREAKSLNPRQARWALFFTRFNFKITYRPGSKNISADALSRLHSLDQSADPEPILPSNLIVSPIIWEMDSDIHNATCDLAQREMYINNYN